MNTIKTFKGLSAGFVLSLLLQAPSQAQEIIVDNIVGAKFSISGTWSPSTAIGGYTGPNYLTHESGAEYPDAVVIDNGGAGYTVQGDWTNSTAISGYLGSNYQHRKADGLPAGGQILDNDNAATVESGGWDSSTSISGYLGTSYRTAPGGDGQKVFTWSLGGLTQQAGSYKLYVRWTAHANRASNAPYTLTTGSNSHSFTVNQKQGGGQWALIGSYSFDAGQGSLTLNNQADGYVIADAIALVPDGAGSNQARWTPALSQAGTYQVYARWPAHANRATNATYTVSTSSGDVAVTVNQQQNGGRWNLLGSYALTPGQASVTLSDQADGYVIADAVRFVPQGAQAAHVVWRPQVPQVGRYDVYARWSAHANRATNAPYTVLHADGQAPVAVNQREEGGQWRLLGNYKLNANSTIKLGTENTDGYVIADGIRVVLTQADTDAQAYYIHSDHLDTPRLITNGQNQAVWRNLPITEPFGDAVPEEDPGITDTSFKFNLRFPGQYFDKETNLSYNYFRDYDPNTGRYVQSDPIGLQGGINTYSYVYLNPLRHTDKHGLQVAPASSAGSAGIAAACNCMSSTSSKRPEDNFGLPPEFDPYRDTHATTHVPPFYPTKDPSKCDAQFSEDMGVCQRTCGPLSVARYWCLAKAYLKYRACQKIYNPLGRDWTDFD